MTELIQREMQEIFFMFYGGLSVMLVFAVRNRILERVKNYKRIYAVIYLLFWIIAAYLFYQFLYAGSYGMMTWYNLLSFAFGILLWNKGICGILMLKNTVYEYNGDEGYEKKKKGARKKVRRAAKQSTGTTESR